MRIAVRAEVDAIAVGSGTMIADDPLLTVARGATAERRWRAWSSTGGCGSPSARACSRRSTQDR